MKGMAIRVHQIILPFFTVTGALMKDKKEKESAILFPGNASLKIQEKKIRSVSYRWLPVQGINRLYLLFYGLIPCSFL